MRNAVGCLWIRGERVRYLLRHSCLETSIHEGIRPRVPFVTIRLNSTSSSLATRVQNFWQDEVQVAQQGKWSTPMKNPSKQIRLLQLPNALGKNGEVQVTMQTYDLDEVPAYQAISYSCGPPFRTDSSEYSTWARPAEDLKIVCNNELIQVGQNLLEGLQAIIPRYPGALLWADALCIDQHNDAEKLRQIYLMDSIYKDAKEVLVWLGPGADPQPSSHEDQSRAMYFYNLFIAEDQVWSENVEANRKLWVALTGLPPTEIDQLLLEGIVLVMEIFSRTWWSRMWTFQEALLSRKMLYLYGSHSLDPGKLRQLIEHLSIPRMLPPQSLDILSRLTRLSAELDWSSLKKRIFFPTESDLKQTSDNGDISAVQQIMYGLGKDCNFAVIVLLLMILTRTRVATESRDQVLSLMGVAKEIAARLGGHIDNDFAVSERNIYGFWSETAKYVLPQDPNLEILRYADKYIDTEKGSSRMPSWAPDFEQLDARPRLRVTGDWACGEASAKSRNVSRQFSTSIGLGFPTFVLFGNEAFGLRGVKVGDIHSLSRVPGLLTTLLDQPGGFTAGKIACLQAMLRFCSNIPIRYWTNPDLLPGLWRVLTLNVSACGQKEFEKWAVCTFIISELQATENKTNVLDREAAKYLGLIENMSSYIPDLKRVKPIEGRTTNLENELLFQQQESGISLPAFPYNLFHVGDEKIGSTAMMAREGDSVWILESARHPFILRPTWLPGYFRLVGEAYVDGVMKGEILQERGDDPRWKSIWLV